MTKEELRIECEKLFNCNTMNDCIEMLNIYSEFFFQTITNHSHEKVFTQSDSDARYILQMMLTKALYLEKAINGVSFHSKNGYDLNKIIDPITISSFVRNIYETTSLFNLIYRHPKSKEESEIIYLLWVHSGLSYRQRFESDIVSNEYYQKLEIERKELERIKEKIESNQLFQALTEKNKGKIRNRLKQREYLIRFDDGNVIFLHWHELPNTMNIKYGLLNNAYSYFSQYTHPSNVAVFQFMELFDPVKMTYIETTIFNLRIAFFMFSIFIADYITLFPSAINTYEKLNIVDQIVINYHNNVSRGIEYSINDSWKACE